MESIIKNVERILLGVIAAATVFATGQELWLLVEIRRVELADLLLLFIYTEVLGMIEVFYKSNKIPMILPLFIVITALSLMIILRRKGSSQENLLYETGAILLLSTACLVIRRKSLTELVGKSD